MQGKQAGPWAVLWDMDGTLVDSEEYHWRAWQETLERHGVRVTRQQFLASFGLRNADFLLSWLGETATPELAAKVGDEKEEAYRQAVLRHGLQPLPGAAALVQALAETGWRQAVASSAPRENVVAVLHATGLAPFFGAVAAAQDVEQGKPHPAVFLAAAQKLSVPPECCIAIEDAPAGVEAARRAGMLVIGVGPRFLSLDAWRVVPSLHALSPVDFDEAREASEALR